MLCSAVYAMAADYAVTPVNADGSAADLSAKVPAILTALTIELRAIADIYCRKTGEMEGRFQPVEVTALTDRFPLPERFAPAAALYLASMLSLYACDLDYRGSDTDSSVEDGSSEKSESESRRNRSVCLKVSDTLYRRYERSLEALMAEFPAVTESITDRYANV